MGNQVFFQKGEENKNPITFFKEIIMKLIDFFENINARKDIDYSENDLKNIITLIYERKKDKIIRLFGDEFVWRNKNRCKIIINNKEKDLCTYFDTTNIMLNNNLLVIQLEKQKIL